MRLLISVASRAGQAGGGSFKREKNRKPKKDFAYRIVCDSLDWLNLFLMIWTKLASGGGSGSGSWVVVVVVRSIRSIRSILVVFS